MEAQSFYDTYHTWHMQGPPPPPLPLSEDLSNYRPAQPTWPKVMGGAFAVPNADPDTFPMPVPESDIINSTDHPSGPATVYSGIEPLASLNGPGLQMHFNDTSIPSAANLIRPGSGSFKNILLNPTESSQQQTDLLHKMAASMQHHRT